jgi:hypothetical protein
MKQNYLLYFQQNFLQVFIISAQVFNLFNGGKMETASLSTPGSSYQPMTIGDWIVTFIISYIPLVGFIMLFVWAFGDGTHPSKKTWAQAALIMVLIFIILSIVFFGIFASILGGIFSGYYEQSV